MAEIINLRLARKAKKRGEAQARADQNRAASGLTKAEKARQSAEKARAARDLEGHKRGDS